MGFHVTRVVKIKFLWGHPRVIFLVYIHWMKWVYLFKRLEKIEERIIMDNAAQIAALTALTAKVDAQAVVTAKIGGETTALIDTVAALKLALENAGGTSPEVDALLAALTVSVDNLSAALQTVDDKVVDPAP
jgi:hypothetical protein